MTDYAILGRMRDQRHPSHLGYVEAASESEALKQARVALALPEVALIWVGKYWPTTKRAEVLESYAREYGKALPRCSANWPEFVAWGSGSVATISGGEVRISEGALKLYAKNVISLRRMAEKAAAMAPKKYRGYTAAELRANVAEYEAIAEGRAIPLSLGPNRASFMRARAEHLAAARWTKRTRPRAFAAGPGRPA